MLAVNSTVTLVLMLALSVMVQSIHRARPEDCEKLHCSAPGDHACPSYCECVFMGFGYACVPVQNWISRLGNFRPRPPFPRRRRRRL
uniref:Tick defensin n=1 Tax=Rhipicephalus appendiculatus TaxID=34631 RepID=A0A131Z3B5_RHIAP